MHGERAPLHAALARAGALDRQLLHNLRRAIILDGWAGSLAPRRT